MSVYKQFKTDKRREVEGVPLEFDEGFVIRIARAGGANKAYTRALERFARANRVQLRQLSISEDRMRGVLIKVYADTVVLGWENCTDEEGNDMPCTRENVVKLFTDLPDLFDDVRERAESMSCFKEGLLEDEAKNL